MEEIWKDIEGFEGIYQISNYGRLKSLSRSVKIKSGFRTTKEKIIKPSIGTCGYYQYPLTNGGVRKTILIHREVAKAFVNNPNNLCEINHKDENKLNNFFGNLEWCDKKYNNTYKDRKKREIETQRNTHPSRKRILQIDENNYVVCEYQSIREAERMTGIRHSNICETLKGRRKSAGGYYWEYVSD